MSRDIDNEDDVRLLRAELVAVEVFINSKEFKAYCLLVDASIAKLAKRLESGVDDHREMDKLVGRIKGLRDCKDLPADERIRLRKELTTRGARP